MVKLRTQRGDTLIEVTFALAILGFVLLSSMALVSSAFRMGQTARERTQVSEDAQEQMEALRSFRDNHTWQEFQYGGGSYTGLENTPMVACGFNAALRCFHMKLSGTGGGTQEWTPVSGNMPGTVPTSTIEIATTTGQAAQKACAYVFELHYSFTPLGASVPAKNQIVTKLANLKYTGSAAACP